MTAVTGTLSKRGKIDGSALRTPRSAAYAGIVFAVLLTISLVTIHLAITAKATNTSDWLYDSQRRRLVLVALSVMPFAGIAFLWFVGVVRDRVGEREDRFFATLFLGSALVFVAIIMVAEAIAAGMIASVGSNVSTFGTSSGWTIGHQVTAQLVEGALQVVGVFTTAASTILLRTSIGARWLGIAGYALSVVLFTANYFFAWSALLFPLWVLAISVDILLAERRSQLQSPV